MKDLVRVVCGVKGCDKVLLKVTEGSGADEVVVGAVPQRQRDNGSGTATQTAYALEELLDEHFFLECRRDKQRTVSGEKILGAVRVSRSKRRTQHLVSEDPSGTPLSIRR